MNRPKIADQPIWEILINDRNTARYKILTSRVIENPVIEIGCHYGYFACLLAEKYEVTAIDFDPEFLRIAEEVARVNNIKIDYVKANAKKMPFDDGQFRTGFLCELLEHLTDPLVVLKEAARVVSKYLYITTPAKGIMPPDEVRAHKQDFTIANVVKLAKDAGLVVTDSFADNTFNYVFTRKRP